EALDAGGDRRGQRLPAVAVHGEGAADAEGGVALHDGDGAAEAVEVGDDPVPRRAGAGGEALRFRVVPDAVMPEHVQDDAVRGDGLPSHRVAEAGDGDVGAAGAGADEGFADLAQGVVVGRGDVDDLRDARVVQIAGVIG